VIAKICGNVLVWGAQAASLSLPATLPATSLRSLSSNRPKIAQPRQAAETCRLAACAPQNNFVESKTQGRRIITGKTYFT